VAAESSKKSSEKPKISKFKRSMTKYADAYALQRKKNIGSRVRTPGEKVEV